MLVEQVFALYFFTTVTKHGVLSQIQNAKFIRPFCFILEERKPIHLTEARQKGGVVSCLLEAVET